MKTVTIARAGSMSVLLMLFTATVVASAEFSPADVDGRFNYLVTFAEPGLLVRHREQRSAGERFNSRSPDIQSARDTLMALQASHLAEMAAALRRTVTPSHYFLVTHSGMTIRLTEIEARQLASLPQIQSVERERVYALSTYRGPEFIGAGSIWDGTGVPGATELEGRGMVAAILDTGIPAAAHASFINAPDCGHGSTYPDKVLSSLDCASTDGTGMCNGPSPEDSNGHGSHTASTVAGNRIDDSATPSPTIPGAFSEMSGVAPCAHIRSYKTCPTNQCPQSNLVGGLSSVLLHSDVDVVNFSISGGANPWNDNDRIKLDMVDAGLFVAASAGNTQGNPNPVGRVNHRGPWVMSVAASTRDTDNLGGSAQGDVLAGFSLRGPTPGPLGDLQKPNITAPGQAIYAAVPTGYAFYNGTSMSGPHVAGAGLLVAQANPEWAPSEIKSAIEMTAFKGGSKENGSTPWDWDDVGSGRVDLTRAARAGLVMDETFQNYLESNPAAGGDVRTLNLASVRDLGCTAFCTFTRTVRNTLSDPTSWSVSGTAFEDDFLVEVSPTSFSFSGDTSETQELTITLSPSSDTTGSIAFGEIVLTEAGEASPDLHLTAALSGVAGPGMSVAPSSFALTVEQGDSRSAQLVISNPGTVDLDWSIAKATPDSLQAAVRGVIDVDEVVEIPDFTVSPAASVDVDIQAGVANSGNVLGFTFLGTVTDIGGSDFASDLRMVVTAPDSSSFEVGGFDGLINPWQFQGGESTGPGTYISTHDGVFGAGTADVGDWNFVFEHDWSSGSDMSWENVTVMLQKQADICQNVENIAWLAIDTLSGTVESGSDSLVQVQVDSAGLALGFHEAQVCISSNAANASIIALPITLRVVERGLFLDRFEQP